MERFGKRPRTSGFTAFPRIDLGAFSSGTVSTNLDGSCYYDTNITAAQSNNFGINSDGVHGVNAAFIDTRSSNPIISETKDYTITLMRGTLTTNNIPLCVPVLRQTQTQGPTPIVENGVEAYELALQPGLSCTWTGPVFQCNEDNNAFDPNALALTASWPTYGVIYYYSENTALNIATDTMPSQTRGFIRLSQYGVSADCLSNDVATRLNAAFIVAGIPITASIPSTSLGGVAADYTQKLSFTNASANLTFIFDFTVPGTSTTLGAPYNKGGMLQAAKILGFQPNSVFSIPPQSTVSTPRQLQLGFRATLELSSYKNCRWVPEDDSAVMPTPADIRSGYTGSYFDCYTYEHLLNQVVNPTLARCISDEGDANAIISEQCLNRQLSTRCAANCKATAYWNEKTVYNIGDAVIYKGYVYVAQYQSGVKHAHAPAQVPGSPSSFFWLSCGPSILNSWVSGTTYNTGDVVTFLRLDNIVQLFSCITPDPNPTTIPVDNPNWNSLMLCCGSNPATSLATIGTTPPFLTYTSATRLFKLNLDCYGFGGTQSTNADDGYIGVNDDTASVFTPNQQLLNSSYNDQARDSWGVTGLSPILKPGTTFYTTARHPGICYDEKFSIEADDYFNCLFGNWPTLRLLYVNPRTNVQTSYVRYTPQAFNMGLAVPLPLQTQTTTVGSTGYLPYDRISGNTIYLYTAQQDYPSVGNMWNPVDTIVVVTSHVPVTEDQTQPVNYVGDTSATLASRSQNTSQTLMILGEFVVKSPDQPGQQYRSEIIFEPQVPRPVPLKTSSDFKTFDYSIFMRMKNGGYRPVSLSGGGGSLFMCFRLDRSARSLGY
jgi:hypothetical protein